MSRTHIGRELGLSLELAGDELRGAAAIVPEMHTPGTDLVRTSILAAWADQVAGLLVARLIAPRVPVTLELSVDLYREPVRYERVRANGRIVKAGRSVIVVSVDFTTDDGEPVAMSTASFMAAPDISLTMPPLDNLRLENRGPAPRLRMPFAERARCVRRAPGVAALPRSEDGLNSSGTINGGLIALAVEEAALSLTPGSTLLSLAMRYTRPARIGPAVATASLHGDLASVEVRDEGGEDRIVVLATTRALPVSPA